MYFTLLWKTGILANFNYEQIVAQAKQLCPALLSPDVKMRQMAHEKLSDILQSVSSRDFPFAAFRSNTIDHKHPALFW